MRPVLFRGARLVDPSRRLDAVGDLLVADRRIAQAGGRIEAADAALVDAAGRVLCPGLVDAGVFAVDVEAAVAGGVTTAVLMPDQAPPLDDPAVVERAVRLGKPRLWVQPLAAATRGLGGTELADIGLLRAAGAVGVATGRQGIADASVMLRVLRYAAGLGLLVVVHAECAALTDGTVATEGDVATRLGLPAAPAEAEAIAVARDLALARIAGARIHFACLSTASALALLAEAQGAGQDVTAGTAPPYALLSDLALLGWRSFARLSPPLRAEADRAAVRRALAGGTLLNLASRHDPRTQEEKRLPFAEAAPGAADQAALLALGLTLVHDGTLPLARLVELLSTAPARRFGLEGGTLAAGAPADLLLFDPDSAWRIDSGDLPARAGNTPFDGMPVSGRAVVVMKGGEMGA